MLRSSALKRLSLKPVIVCKFQFSLHSLGNGLYGGLGHGDYEVYSSPVVIDSIKNEEVSSISAGWAHSVVLTRHGDVFVWGQPYELLKVQRIYRQQLRYGLNWAKLWHNFVSSLAPHGGPSGYKFPVLMGGLPAHEKVVQVACGVALTAVRCESGTLYMFGMNDFGQCGVGTNILKANVKERTIYNPRRPVGALSPIPSDFDYAAFEETVYDEQHKKGSKKGEERYETMFNELVASLPPLQGQQVVDVSLGYSHGAAITNSGGLITWGKGLRGQLGNGRILDETDPQRCCLEQDLTPIDQQGNFERSFTHSPGSPIPSSVSCGATHTACLTKCGQVYVWGKFQSNEVKKDEYEGVVREIMKKDREGKLLYEDALRPRRVQLPPGRHAVQVACSAYHTTILLDNNEVLAMGVMIGSGHIVPNPIPLTVQVERTNELGEGWDESSMERVEISSLLKEQHDDSIAFIKGGSSANCSGIVTTKGRCFTVFFCYEEPVDLTDAYVAAIPDVWSPAESTDKVRDMAIGWQHTLLNVK